MVGGLEASGSGSRLEDPVATLSRAGIRSREAPGIARLHERARGRRRSAGRAPTLNQPRLADRRRFETPERHATLETSSQARFRISARDPKTGRGGLHRPAERVARLPQGRSPLTYVQVRQHQRLTAGLMRDAPRLAGRQVHVRGGQRGRFGQQQIGAGRVLAERGRDGGVARVDECSTAGVDADPVRDARVNSARESGAGHRRLRAPCRGRTRRPSDRTSAGDRRRGHWPRTAPSAVPPRRAAHTAPAASIRLQGRTRVRSRAGSDLRRGRSAGARARSHRAARRRAQAARTGLPARSRAGCAIHPR